MTHKELSALLGKTSIIDHEKVLQSANNGLRENPEDAELHHIRLVALIKLDRYDEAVKILESGGKSLEDRADVEKAYALYKNGQLDAASDVARSCQKSRGLQHVEAQISYRAESPARALEIYEELVQDEAYRGIEDHDLRVNQSAAKAQCAWAQESPSSWEQEEAWGSQHVESFMTAYNVGCVYVARQDFVKASEWLHRARELCNATDELTPEEKVQEIISINVQLLYISIKLDKEPDVRQLLEQISQQGVTDQSTKTVLSHNQLILDPTNTNPFLIQRNFQQIQTPDKADALFANQAQLIAENEQISNFSAYKPNGVIKSTSKITKDHQPSTLKHINKFSVLNAAAHAEGDLTKLGLKRILPLFRKHPTDVGLAVTIIHFYILMDRQGSATTVLDKLLSSLARSEDTNHQNVRFAPGILALQIALYRLQNRRAQITTALANAATYWRDKSKAPFSLLEQCGSHLLYSSQSKYQDLARDVFQRLSHNRQVSKISQAGYIASHALHQPNDVSKDFRATLPSVQSLLPSNLDISSLEDGPFPIPQSRNNPLPSRKRGREQQSANDKTNPPKKRHRKSRLPKDFDPSKTPDPERWLPLRERSSYKPKAAKKGQKGGKKQQQKMQKKRGGADRTQGGIVPESVDEDKAVIIGGAATPSRKKKKGKK